MEPCLQALTMQVLYVALIHPAGASRTVFHFRQRPLLIHTQEQAPGRSVCVYRQERVGNISLATKYYN